MSVGRSKEGREPHHSLTFRVADIGQQSLVTSPGILSRFWISAKWSSRLTVAVPHLSGQSIHLHFV